ncbi:hypothetical protein F5X96DRAFT_182856 [Biscogniauxia mediterranea]|nr:hypothetical protein F5X96DRAFT_182856 [Biscogniauxia mediterranea]
MSLCRFLHTLATINTATEAIPMQFHFAAGIFQRTNGVRGDDGMIQRRPRTGKLFLQNPYYTTLHIYMPMLDIAFVRSSERAISAAFVLMKLYLVNLGHTGKTRRDTYVYSNW